MIRAWALYAPEEVLVPEHAPFRHYRICNAVYAVLTADDMIYRKANEAADRLAALGLHLGSVRLDPGCAEPQLRSMATLLHPLQACAVVDPARPMWLAQAAKEALEGASRDGSSPWRGHLPRVLWFRPAADWSVRDLVALAQGLASHTLSEDDLELRILRPAERKGQQRVSGRRASAAVA